MASRYWVGGTATWDATAGSKWATTSGGAGGQSVPTSSDDVFINAASGAGTITISAGTAICNILTMTGFTGTLAFGTNSITISGIGNINIFAGGTTYSVTGTPLILATGVGVAGQTRAISGMALVTEDNAISFTFSAGADNINTGTTNVYKNLTFTSGFTGNLNGQDRVIHGNLTLSSGMTSSATSGSTVIGSTNGSQQVTTNGSLVNFNLSIGRSLATTAATGNGTTATLTFGSQTNLPFRVGGTIVVTDVVPTGYNGTYTVTACTTTTVSYANATTGAQTTAGGIGTTNVIQLQDALTLATARTLTHSSGTFDLNDKTVTTGLFSHGPASARTMAFGTASINITGNNANVWVTNSGSVTTLTGTKTVNLTYSGATGTRACLTGSNAQLLNRFSFNVTAGSDIVNFQNLVNNLNFTGFSGTWQNQILSITGSLTVSSGMTIGAGGNTVQFYNWGGTQQVTSAGKNFDFPVTIGLGTNTTAASGNGTTATLTFVSANLFPPVGSTIVVAGITPAGYNGTYAVTASTTTSVSYANATTGAQTVGGTIWTSSTVRLVDNLSVGTTASRVVTLGAGTLDLNNNTLTNFGIFSSNTTAVRSIVFGTTGNYTNTNTANATVWSASTITGLTYTGTPTVNLTGNAVSGVTRTISHGNTAGGTEANAVSFNISAGSDNIAASGNTVLKDLIFSGTFTGTINNNTRTVYGNLTYKTGMTIAAGSFVTSFLATSGTQTITSAGLNLDFPITLGGTATYLLADALLVGTATGRNFTLTSGTLDLNDKTLTVFGNFSSSNTNTRSVLFGTTGSITLTSSAATILGIAIATNFSITGIPTINVTGNATTGLRRLDYGTTNAPASPEANSLSVYVTAGSDSVQLSSTFYTRNLDFTGSFTGSLVNSTRSIYGNYTLNPNMTVTAGTLTTSFLATSGTQLITTAGRLLDIPVTVNAVGAGVQLVDNFTAGVTRTFTLTAGTLDLNNRLLSTGLFFTNSTLTREIIFGNDSVNGIIKATGYSTAGNTTLVFRADGVTGLTLTGYPQVILDATLGDPTGIRSITGGLSSTEARRFFINVINGTDIVNIGGTRDYRTIDFTGFSGTLQLAGTNNAAMSGGLIFSNAMTVGTLAFGFSFSSIYGASFTASQSGFNLTVSSVTGLLGVGSTVADASNNNIGKILSQISGTTGGAGVYALDTSATIASQAMTSFWRIDTQNKTIGASIGFSTNGSSWKLQSPLTITGGLGLSNGTFNSNSQSITCDNFGYNNGNTKTLILANSTVTITGGTSASGFSGSNTGTTYNLTGVYITFTTSGTALFNAGGPTTASAVNMGGTGQLIIGQDSSSATITTLSNTVQPCTISLLSTMLRLNVTNFNLSGTAGNLVTLNTTVAGTARTVRKTSGTVNAYYLNIQDSIADGGAVWNAINSTNAGNNTGWNFLIGNSGNFFLLF